MPFGATTSVRILTWCPSSERAVESGSWNYSLSAAQHFINGLQPAVWTGAGVLLVASLAMWLVPSRAKQSEVVGAAVTDAA